MKKKKDEIPEKANVNILIYDDKNINYYEGVLASFDIHNDWDISRSITGNTYETLRGKNINFYVPNLEQFDTIKLDDTLMRRIEKFNKEIEIKKLDKKIEDKKAKIKELDNLLQDKEKRWDKVKKYIEDIYNIDLEDDYDDEEYWED